MTLLYAAYLKPLQGRHSVVDVSRRLHVAADHDQLGAVCMLDGVLAASPLLHAKDTSHFAPGLRGLDAIR